MVTDLASLHGLHCIVDLSELDPMAHEAIAVELFRPPQRNALV